MGEETLVINDLLSFLVCKLPNYSKYNLLKAIRGFYSEDDIQEAHDTLLASLPNKKSLSKVRKVKIKDPLLKIYEMIKLVPEDDLPTLVCQDLNNIPYIASDEAKSHASSGDEVDFDFETENKEMKKEIRKLALLANRLKEQMSNYLENSNLDMDMEPMDFEEESPSFSNSLKKNKYSTNFQKNFTEKPDQNSMDSDDENWNDSFNSINKSHDDDDDEDDDENIFEEQDMEQAAEDGENLKSIKQEENSDQILCIDDNSQNNLDSDPVQGGSKNSIELSSVGSCIAEKEHQNSMISNADKNSEFDGMTFSELSESTFSKTFLKETNGICVDSHILENDNPLTDANSSVNIQFSCKRCAFKSFDLLDYNSHLLSHYSSDIDSYECSQCIMKFDGIEELDEHLNIHNWRKPFSCHLCSYTSKDDSSIRSHYLKHYENKVPNRFECLMCGKICGTRNSLAKHKQLHKRNFCFECEYCHLTFPHKSALSQHLASHTREKNFICDYCGYNCNSNHALETHVKVHFKSDDIFCHICNEQFYSKVTLRNHISSQHPEDKPFKCDFCNKSFTYKHTYLVHRKIHLKSQLFVCKYCNKKFKSQSYLKIHYAVHEGKKPFKCHFCDYESVSKSLITKHEGIHDIQILACKKCSFTTKFRKDLEKHSLSHTSESFVDKLVIIMDD